MRLVGYVSSMIMIWIAW